MRIYVFFLLFLANKSIFGQNIRTLDGSGNNAVHQVWGAANTKFVWSTSIAYADNMAAPAGGNRMSARAISNLLCHQDTFMANELGLSDYVWAWGQLIDHDLTLNVTATPAEIIEITVPFCDPFFDPNCTGTVTIPIRRAEYDPATGTSESNPRTHINRTTSFLDGSVVYGTDPFRLAWMRTYYDGKMKTSLDNLMPYNTVTGKYGAVIDPNAPAMSLDGGFPSKYFVSGDIRANEQPVLSCLHTLFVREHNRLCDEIKQLQPTLTDEQIFQRARKVVGALLQAITYEEFLPTIGVHLSPYSGYNPSVNPSIMNVFSGAAFRFGHSAVTGRLLRLEENGDTSILESVDIRSAFADPTFLQNEGGIEPFLRGVAVQKHQKIDTKVFSDLRNFLFGNPGSGGMDLIAINIERGREKGLPDFNTLRQDFGLSPIHDFEDITNDTEMQQLLQTAYGSVDSIDAWIGLMSEEHVPNSIFGESMVEIMKHQFEVIRDGDRLYYEQDPTFSGLEIAAIKSTRLADVIRRNTNIQAIQDSVFIVKPKNTVAVELFPFQKIRNLTLSAFPNPTQKFFNLKVESTEFAMGTLRVIDAVGRVVKVQNLELTKGENVFEIELDDAMVQGVYSIQMIVRGDSGSLNILKLGNN